MSLWSQKTWDSGKRYAAFEAFCTNPSCHHARKPHPIKGLATYGSRYEPPDATDTCPACDWPVDSEPLFLTDEPITEDEA